MNLKAVFFDLDGTLLDTATDLATALNRLLIEEKMDALPITDIRRVVSDGAYAMLKLAFDVDRKHPRTKDLRQRLLDFYLDDLSSHTTFFPGIEDLITRLDETDIDWGVVTNKPAAYAEPLMQRFNCARPPICVICPDHVEHRKPHQESLELACAQAQCEKHEAIYVGDHLRDIQCGKNADISTIAVNYGYIAVNDSAYNWNADFVVEHGQDIWPIISNYLTEETKL